MSPQTIDWGSAEKYSYVVHAEANAILNCLVSPRLTDCPTIYCTGVPCLECAKLIVNAGIERCVIAYRRGTKAWDAEKQQQLHRILVGMKVEVLDLEDVRSGLEAALDIVRSADPPQWNFLNNAYGEA